MSYDLGVHVWYPDVDPLERPLIFASAAASLPGLIAGRLTVADTDPSEIVVDLELMAGDELTVEQAVRPFIGENFCYQLERTFECNVATEASKLAVRERRPLSLHLCGTGYGVDGYYQKRNGLLRLSFSSVRIFQVPPSLLKRAQALASGSTEQTEVLHLMSELSRNMEIIHSVAHEIIKRTDPSHLMVCTEWEVHPLTAHAIYHREVMDFGRDLSRIVVLNEQGGLYLQSPEITRKYADPRRASLEYGYLRNSQDSAKLASRIDDLKDRLSKGGTLSERLIMDTVMTSPKTEARQFGRGLYVSTVDGACGYLEQHLFDLASSLGRAENIYLH